MKTLIITEKREAGAEMAATLGDKILGSNAEKLKDISKSKGYLEGETYIICWAAGHLYSQVNPGKIKEEYQLFKPYKNKEDYKMPNLLSEIRSEAGEHANKQRQIKILKEIFLRSDINEIIIMTDADAEGEAIGRDIVEKIVKNLPTQNITRAFNTGSFKAKEAVQKALNERQKLYSNKYNWLYDSQQVRSKLDYLYGMKTTKALCDTYNKKLYTGRVKAVITSLIGAREDEIRNFVSKDFYTLIGKKGNVELKHFYYEEQTNEDGSTSQNKQERYYSAKALEDVIFQINEVNATGTVIEYKKEEIISKNRPLPLSGTDFASEMMGKYKINYKQCNEILDYLRNEGFTTYPGTNGRYFSKDDESDVQQAFITAKKYFSIDVDYSKTAELFDDTKAAKQNHTPLSPTTKIPTERDIQIWQNEKLSKIKEGYELIASRILVHFLPPDKIEKQSLTININNCLFFVTGQKAIEQGWRSIVDKEIKNTLFDIELKENDIIKLDNLEQKTGKTKCPVLFTEKTLVDMMVNIAKVIDEMIEDESDPEKLKELKKNKKLLKEAEGIGTDRTREGIISDLLTDEIIINTKEGLILSVNGKVIFDVLPQYLKDPIFTASLENEFEKIRRGEVKASEVLAKFDELLMSEIIMEIVNCPKMEYIKQSTTIINGSVCPLCGAELLETAQTYKCSNNQYKDGKQSGCRFSFFRDQTKFFGRKLSAKDIPALFDASAIAPLKDNKNGIYIDLTNQYFITTIFEQREAKPDELIETPKTFKLNNKFVFKNILGKDLTQKEATILLEGKIAELKRKSKAGKDYVTKVKLNDKGGVDFVEEQK